MTFQSEEKQNKIYKALNKINNNRHLKSVKSTVEIISQLIENIKHQKIAVDTTGQKHKLPRIKTRETKYSTSTYITNYINNKRNGYYIVCSFFYYSL